MKSRKKAFAVATLVGAPLLFLLILEGILALAGYGTTYESEDPFLGFRNAVSLFELSTESGTPVYRTRASKLQWFNMEEFPAKKPDNEYRIFCLGGSTTYGRPYSGKTAYAHWMELLLQAADPAMHYRVINAGGVSYASYREANLIAEMVKYEPDLFVVFTGHNEFLEDRTYAGILEQNTFLSSVRAELNHLRTYSLVRNAWLSYTGKTKEEAEEKFQMTGEVNAILDQSYGLDRYHRDDTKSKEIVAHFRLNLNRMVDIAEENKVPILFVVPASNEKDFSPFKSEFSRDLTPDERHRWQGLYSAGTKDLEKGEGADALTDFEQLSALDSGYADARFRTGQALLSVGDVARAKMEFVAARDMDVAPLRATSEIQQAVRDVAAERSIPVFDLLNVLEQRQLSEHGMTALGSEFFLDHVHPTIEVHQLIAENLVELAEKNVPELGGRTFRTVDRKALYDSVTATLDPVYLGLKDLNLAKVLRWAGKKEEARPFVERAAAELPDHPEAQYLLGLALKERGDFAGAGKAFEHAIQLDPQNPNPYNSLGSLLLRLNSPQKAVELLTKATELAPGQAGIYYNLGNALYQTGKSEQAIQAFREAIRIDPKHTMALNNLGAIYLQRRELDLAAPLFEKTVTLDPGNIEAYSNLGVIAFLRGSLDESRSMFEKVLQVRPDDEYALQWLKKISATSQQKGS